MGTTKDLDALAKTVRDLAISETFSLLGAEDTTAEACREMAKEILEEMIVEKLLTEEQAVVVFSKIVIDLPDYDRNEDDEEITTH